jgi:ankyrin repeat protein
VVQDGWTVLHKAAQNGHTKTVEALLTAGAEFARNKVRHPSVFFTASVMTDAENRSVTTTVGRTR